MAASLGAKVETLSFGKSSAVDPAQVEDYLRADKEGRIKAILCVLVDTSTGVRNDIKAIRSVMDAAGHDALLMCDCIASMGCDEFHMDEWGVDVAVAGSQKGLMTPPGIGFVWFNDRADAVRGAMPRVSSYWDWRPRVNPKEYFRLFNGTAPTHHIYGLREALDMIKEEGLEQVWARHEGLAHAIWSACDAWSAEGPFEINVKDPNARSRAVTSLRLGEGQGDALRAWCEQNMGVTLGLGIGRTPASAFFRFGHMGHVSGHMVLGFLGAVDTGLKALEIPHGSGALEAASAVLAQHVRGHICAPEPQASQGDVNGCCG